MPDLDMDEPLLHPGRVLRAVRWWLWFYCDPTLDHERQVQLTVWHLVRTYRRSFANRDRY